ncbi:MAG: hypothetical protein CM15mP109_10530 [Candidatus Dadabacteria bacterium]|nr:MAG: hypothetical protein CM15mP109_10530 [Candidatus Dadabacteria bacterium]
MLVLQPAEGGWPGFASYVRRWPFLKFPRPDFNLALHVGGMAPAGTIGFQLGYAKANVDSVDIIVNGVGGSWSLPPYNN